SSIVASALPPTATKAAAAPTAITRPRTTSPAATRRSRVRDPSLAAKSAAKSSSSDPAMAPCCYSGQRRSTRSGPCRRASSGSKAAPGRGAPRQHAGRLLRPARTGSGARLEPNSEMREAAHLVRERLAGALERPLRGGVGDLIGGGDEPGDRGDVHDGAPPPLAHRGEHRLNAPYRAEVVGLEHAPVLVLGRQLERGGPADAGIVDEHVHGPVPRHRLEGAAHRGSRRAV